jgi:transcriptional regulator with XRE-family HTH domain
MAAGDLPAVARRRVRMALREAREKKDLTQSQVAEAMEWSLSKVMRIESGEVTIAPNDLRFLLAYLGITDRARVDELLHYAKTARRRQMWWEEPRFRDHITPAMRQLIQYESEATAVRHFYTMIVPGRLQTPAYAQAILHSYRNDLPEEDIKVRLEVRMRRRTELLARKPPPQILLLLDESVLYRAVGGAQVMREQLSNLVKLAHEGRVAARVVPFTVDAPLPLMGSYDVLDLGDGDAVMYRESNTVDEIVEDQGKIRLHREIFEQLWRAALDENTSARLIQERAESVVSTAASGDQPTP